MVIFLGTSRHLFHKHGSHPQPVGGYGDRQRVTPKNGWEITGLDWNTGETVHQTIFGDINFGNGAYAILQYLKGDELLFNTFSGPIRVQYDTGGSGGCAAGFSPLAVLLFVPLFFMKR